MENEIKVNTADDVLENAKGKFSNVLILGLLKDGKVIDISTNRATFEFVNYMLNRANWQVNLMENNQINDYLAQQAAAEQAVADQVAANVEMEVALPKKRGRKKAQ